MRQLSFVLFIVVPALVGPIAAPAQRPAALTLKPASGVVPGEFTSIGMIRELANGRVIVLDTGQKKVLLADFRTGTVAPVSRVGEGPQEYRYPAVLFPLPGDSSLIVDLQLRRWILLAGERPVVTVPPQSLVLAGEGWEGRVRGAGPDGRVVMIFTPRIPERAIDQGDSLYLVRVSRTTGRGDTLTRLRSPFGGPPGSATKNTPEFSAAMPPARPGAQRHYMMAPPISDQAIVFPDGWVAVARVAPYRVDWIDNSGKVRRGAPVAVSITTLDDREKRAYLSRLSKLDGNPAGEPSDIKEWLPAIPPFWGLTTSLFTVPDGQLLIARSPTAALPNPTYDLVDRSGGYRGQLSLQPDERIVGFGANSVYVSVADADGIEKLRRHPWP